MKVDTLYVVMATNSRFDTQDVVNAIEWASMSLHYTVVVNAGFDIDLSDVGARVYDPGLHRTLDAGFSGLAGIAWAIGSRIEFKQVIMLTDSCLITGQGLDAFMLKRTKSAELIGVKVNDTMAITLNNQRFFFDSGLLDHAAGVCNIPAVLSNKVQVLSATLCHTLYANKLLVPHAEDEMITLSGVHYLTAVTYLLGDKVVCWGSATKPLPPFYCCPASTNRLPPHMMNPAFLLYGPLVDSPDYSIRELRNLYKRERGEAHDLVVPNRPIVITKHKHN